MGGVAVARDNTRVFSRRGEPTELASDVSSGNSQGLGEDDTADDGRRDVVAPISRGGVPGVIPMFTPLRLYAPVTLTQQFVTRVRVDAWFVTAVGDVTIPDIGEVRAVHVMLVPGSVQ